ncbi:C40 family peptidase [Phaeacidiphilus oryzae]|uniref:C40 family peptidase n=1 Tax=Phaeacidiphilus oryzae TaxID=348818 RepID=UPI00068CC67B|nr:C40 family peptidase [Phaeacidiphilus oryzae]
MRGLRGAAGVAFGAERAAAVTAVAGAPGPGARPGTRPGTGPLAALGPAALPGANLLLAPAAGSAARPLAGAATPAPGPGPDADADPDSAAVGTGPGPVAARGNAPAPSTLDALDRTFRQLSGLQARVDALSAQASALRAQAGQLAAKAAWQRVRRELMGDAMARLAGYQYADGPLAGLTDLLTGRGGAQRLADRQSAEYQARHAYTVAYQEARRVAALRAAQAARAAAAATAAERRRDAVAASRPALTARRDALLAGIAARFGDGSAASGLLRALPGRAAGPDLQPDGKALRAVLFALAHIGTPYVWGGTSPSGYDCSGLTSQAWAAAGVRIPRTSQAQFAGLPRVPAGQPLRPGDLVVYFPGATHVGMYIGDGLVVHAPRPGTVVRVTTLDRMPSPGVVRPRY